MGKCNAANNRRIIKAGARGSPGPSQRTCLLFGTFDAPEIGLLSRVASQEFAKMPSAKPRRPYLYLRATVAGSCSVRHQVLGWLFARRLVLQPLARHRPPVLFELL
jgi:hypothetical protein